ncbi:Uncharacterised protein [Candidatus Venteria ishoeyi]|uniref:Uncharacterized protein n=1 Tax=Candidatus Venteria ishoeyi TaxID=1899563 RepID=A0A1H6F4C0_9GAMM|nr:Uncharacterised protein [Candidatus Venteria ishoeyi]
MVLETVVSDALTYVFRQIDRKSHIWLINCPAKTPASCASNADTLILNWFLPSESELSEKRSVQTLEKGRFIVSKVADILKLVKRVTSRLDAISYSFSSSIFELGVNKLFSESSLITPFR